MKHSYSFLKWRSYKYEDKSMKLSEMMFIKSDYMMLMSLVSSVGPDWVQHWRVFTRSLSKQPTTSEDCRQMLLWVSRYQRRQIQYSPILLKVITKLNLSASASFVFQTPWYPVCTRGPHIALTSSGRWMSAPAAHVSLETCTVVVNAAPLSHVHRSVCQFDFFSVGSHVRFAANVRNCTSVFMLLIKKWIFTSRVFWTI